MVEQMQMFSSEFQVNYCVQYVYQVSIRNASTPLILGLKGKTRSLSLDQKFHDDFEAGQTDEFEETDNDVGEITAIEMSIGEGIISR